MHQLLFLLSTYCRWKMCLYSGLYDYDHTLFSFPLLSDKSPSPSMFMLLNLFIFLCVADGFKSSPYATL